MPALEVEAIPPGRAGAVLRVLLDLLFGDSEAAAYVHAVHLPTGLKCLVPSR